MYLIYNKDQIKINFKSKFLLIINNGEIPISDKSH